MLRKILAAACFALLGFAASPTYAANAYICELSDMAQTVRGAAQVGVLPCVAEQKKDFSGGAVSATAFNTATRFIRLHCDAACSFNVSGTATTANTRIPLDGVEYFGVSAGAVLSVIANP